MEGVVGRDAELEEIGRWLAAPRPSILLVEGEAGIGKSTLWRAGVDEAERLRYRVLASAAAPSETQLSFTTLRDLLATSFEGVADQLPPPQRRALAVTLLREESPGPPPEPGAIAVAFMTALHALAAHARTLLAVDDVQWIDHSSAGPLSSGHYTNTSDFPVRVLVEAICARA